MNLEKLFLIPRLCALLMAALLMTTGTACGTRAINTRNGDRTGMANGKERGPVNYLALGDSTGVGVGAREGGYVARLFKRIEELRPGSSLTNLCVSGATTEDVLNEQVGPRVTSNATLVTLGIGINDAGRGVPVERFARNYEEIIKGIRARTNAPVVLTNLPDVSLAPSVPVPLRRELGDTIKLFNERIEEISGRYGLRVVNTYQPTHELIPQHPEFFSSDGFHPSDIGYEHWAKLMWPTVKSAIGE
jgi:acyl-CoA thioesterase I